LSWTKNSIKLNMVALEYLAWHIRVSSFELVTLVPEARLKNNIY